MNAITQLIDEIQSTAVLVRAAQAGDREAFGQLFERFQPVVLAIALRRLRDHAEAQELTQDVFVQAMLKLDQLRTPEAFAGWIRQITVRMAINRSMRRIEYVAIDADGFIAQAAEASPLDDVLEIERRSQVRAGLDRLGSLDRQTLIAFYVDGKSLLQMAEDFSAPLGTIKRRLHVARKRLAQEVEELAVA
jgi:RNA polymerase sigma-70 factor (ECF subfamily)